MKILLVFLSWFSAPTGSDPSPKVEAYIEKYRLFAMMEQNRTGIPAAVTMAQALHESGAGEGDLAQRSNNHFGIKCKNTWAGDKVYHDDDARGECFRAYPSVYDSYEDHSDFIKASERYSFLFSYDPGDYKAWAKGLKTAGYATNPKYAEILIKTIEENNLGELTLQAFQLRDSMNTNDVSSAEPSMPLSESVKEAAVNELPVQTFFLPAIKSSSSEFPKGEFSINGCRVVFVEEETSLLALAQQYHLNFGDLLRFNDLDAKALVAGRQLLFLSKKKSEGVAQKYIVKAGETLWQVAQINGVRLESLQAYNPRLSAVKACAAGTIISLKKGKS